MSMVSASTAEVVSTREQLLHGGDVGLGGDQAGALQLRLQGPQVGPRPTAQVGGVRQGATGATSRRPGSLVAPTRSRPSCAPAGSGRGWVAHFEDAPDAPQQLHRQEQHPGHRGLVYPRVAHERPAAAPRSPRTASRPAPPPWPAPGARGTRTGTTARGCDGLEGRARARGAGASGGAGAATALAPPRGAVIGAGTGAGIEVAGGLARLLGYAPGPGRPPPGYPGAGHWCKRGRRRPSFSHYTARPRAGYRRPAPPRP